MTAVPPRPSKHVEVGVVVRTVTPPTHTQSRQAVQVRNTQRTCVSTPSVRDTEEKEPVEPRNARQRKERTDAERRDTGGGGATGPQPRSEGDGCVTVRVEIRVTLRVHILCVLG